MIVVFILSALCWRRIRGLRKLPDGRDSLWGRLGLVLMGRAMFSKSLVQFSVDGQGCVPSLLFDLRPGGGGGGGYEVEVEVEVEVVRIMATSFSRSCTHCCTQCPRCCSRPLSTQASAGDSWTLLGMSGSVSYGVTAPFSWVLVHTRFCLCPPRVCFPSPV